jgi:hypothetical protein
MRVGFAAIKLRDYIELHVRANPGAKRSELAKQLASAIDAYRDGVRCQCGAPIWIIGSAQTRLACFACITGESRPDHDYEIDVADEDASL